MTAAAIQPCSGMSLQDSGEGTLSQWAEFQEAPGILSVHGRKNGQMAGTGPWAVGDGSCAWLGTWEIGDKEVWEEVHL
jgi:hypothetical protein